GARLESGLNDALRSTRTSGCVQRVGSMITLFFQDGPVRNWTDADRSDRERFGRWHTRVLESGVYWPPSQFEAAFLSVAHTDDDIDRTVAVVTAALAAE